ncbi:MAG TPA: PKD domain-containing protein, partial [Candidatus Nitrosotalea sp.]|nr:PKD domain-containing protein [Candidatus Nitrosotalea sp.]
MAVILAAVQIAVDERLLAANSALVGWSDLGIRETDGTDFSVYSLMPPYNTIRAQLILGDKLVTNATGITVTYEAVADSTGSINTTSQNKGNFYQYAEALFGEILAPDEGLAGFAMPGPTNQPQPMVFDPSQNWFSAVGIPLTPYDDQGRKNYYPLMRLVARDSTGTLLARTDIVLPISDEMDCRSCHASGSQAVARPTAGWTWDCDPGRDYKINILRNHDDHHSGSSVYSNVLSQVGYNPAGLVATVLHDGKPVLCVRCHGSNALPGTGVAGMRPLTQLMHMKHAYTVDPDLGIPLINLNDSAACLRCHAGPDTRRLRGVHHNTAGPDGSRAIQCESCHGKMTDLGRAGRQGWLEEPNCQSCHTGTASANNGQLRYTNVFDVSGLVRQAVNQTFATESNTPAAGLSLYQYSQGHGRLKCEACHGSTHAELLSSQPNDNLQSQELQGIPGTLINCTACHTNTPTPATGGPHGMHPVDQNWANNHESGSRSQCLACHGNPDLRGTVLSLTLGSRNFDAMGSKHFWTGFQVGCYNCHAGPNAGDNGGATTNSPANVTSLVATTTAEMPVIVTLHGTDLNNDSLAFRVVSQPGHGTVTVVGNTATYYPVPGFTGNDSFTYSAWDGSTDSNLGTVSLTVTPGNCTLSAGAVAPTAALPNSTVPFNASASLSKCTGTIVYDWDFGDGSSHASDPASCHSYPNPGDYTWTLTASANGVTQTVTGVVSISSTLGPPLILWITPSDYTMLLSWPADSIPTSLETSSDLSDPNGWLQVPDAPVLDSTNLTVETF